MTQAAVATVGLRVSDFTGQKAVRAPAVPVDSSIGELVQRLISTMGLAREDNEGRALGYDARLTREGRHLHGGEKVGDALRDDDELIITPSIQAGSDAGAVRR